ncbi:MAG: polymer-forming cytoskeletal protein [Patescibacteria group bacterium]|mgnify:CR=1 FL=1
MKKILFLFILSFFVLFSFFPAQAIVIQKAEKNVYIDSSKIIDDDLIVRGETVEINGLIKGDLFIAGETITINGNVEGDILGAGRKITINGKVDGDIRIFGEILIFNNQTDRNITVFGQDISFTEKSKVGKNLLIFGENIKTNGKIDGNIYSRGRKTFLAGEINKNVNLETNFLELLPKTIINGSLNYVAPQKANISPDAQISGKTFFKIQSPEKKKNKYTMTFFFWKLVSLFSFLIVGLIFISLFRKETLKIVDQIAKTPWKNLGCGIIYFFIIPIILLFLIAMLIGIPLGLIGICLYFVFLYLAQVFVGITIGVELNKKFKKSTEIVNTENSKNSAQKNDLFGPMILGIIILMILFNIPFFGWFFKIIIIWLGLGGIINVIISKLKFQTQQ